MNADTAARASLPLLVSSHRDADRRLRAHRGRVESGTAGTRNAAATDLHVARLVDTMTAIRAELERRTLTDTATRLRHEHELAERIRQSRRNGIARPELAYRLRRARQMVDTTLELLAGQQRSLETVAGR